MIAGAVDPVPAGALATFNLQSIFMINSAPFTLSLDLMLFAWKRTGAPRKAPVPESS